MKHTLRAILSLVLILYLVIATIATRSSARNDVCTEMVVIVDDSTANPFVTAREIDREMSYLPQRAKGMKFAQLDLDSIEGALNSIDKVEDANVVHYSDGSIVIMVKPMVPVARVFDIGSSYYINKDGKRMTADAHYHIDVPVIEGHFDDEFPPSSIIPLLNYLAENKKWGAMTSMIKVESPSNILLIPYIRGHVINFGSANEEEFDNKFKRLDRMYSEVIPVKGWEFYDTISVKWKGQVVATRREKPMRNLGYTVPVKEEEVDEGTMMSDDGIAPGQALPGKEGVPDEVIPGAIKDNKAKQPEPNPENKPTT